MFNFFKKKTEVMGYNETIPDEFNMDSAYNKWQKEQHKEPIQTVDLSQIIMEIHNSYDSSVDRLVAEAKEILANCQTEDIKKGERLSKLGFINSIKAKQSEEVLRKKAEAEETEATESTA